MIIPIRVSCRHYYNHVNIFGSSHCSAHTFICSTKRLRILHAIEKSTFYVNLVFDLVSFSSLMVVGGYTIALYRYNNNINTTYVDT